jgi:hypothetical protein
MARGVVVGGLVAFLVAATVTVLGPPPAAGAGCDPDASPLTWDGDAGTTSWNEPTNWSGDAVPGAGAHVCIAGEGTSVTFDSGSVSIATIEVQAGSSLSIVGGSLDITGPEPSSFDGLYLFAGSLAGTGPRAITGTVGLYGGTLSGSATTTVATDARLLVGPSGSPNRVTITGGHVLRIEDGASARWGPVNTDVQLDAPASIVNAGNLAILNDTQLFGSGTFANTGSITKASHLQTTIAVPFDNDGSVSIDGGTLEIQTDGGQGTDGNFTLADSAHLRTSTGPVTLGTGASIGGDGTLDVISGTLTIPAGATFEVPAVTVSGGTFTLDGEHDWGFLSLFGGTLTGGGTRVITQAVDLFGGTLSGSATTSAASTAALRIGPGGNPNRLTITGGHILRLDEGATGTWGPVNTDIQLDAPSSIVNAGTFTITNDTQVFGTGTVANQGTLVKASHLQSTIAVPIDNDGTIELRSGTLEIQADGGQGTDGTFDLAELTHLRTSTGTITLGPEASISGPGTLDVISGSLTIPATATLEPGTVTLSSGTLTIDGERSLASVQLFGGTLAGSGTRAVTGTLQLYGGTLAGSATTAAADGADLHIGAGGNPNRLTLGTGVILQIAANASAAWGPVNTDIQLDGTIVNEGRFEITNDTQVFGAGSLVNSGALVKASHMVTTVGALLDNRGMVQIDTGTLDVQGAGLDNATTMRIGSRAVLRAASYRQSAEGTLEIEVGATGQQVAYGQLVVTGEASLGGTLALTAEPRSEPVPSDTRMVVVSAPDLDGGFADTTLPETIIGVAIQYVDEGVVVETN